jgi:CRP/FNR family transcriptional regulator, cyclic AMP receptor protein
MATEDTRPMEIENLRQPELFHGLRDDELKTIAASAQEVRFTAGAVLFEEDSVGDDLWILHTGLLQVEILLPGSREGVGIAQVRPNETVGELALIDGHRRSATARASTDVVLYRFRRSELLKAADENPHLGFVLMQNLARIVTRRLRDTNLALRTTLAQQKKLLGAFF